MEKKTAPRTLVKLGTNSLVITLPKKWLDNNNLTKGDLIFLGEKDNNLILTSKNKPTFKPTETIVEIQKKPFNYVQSEIITSYLVGYDYIKVTGHDIKKYSTKIKDVLRTLSGMEIIEETTNSITAKELLDIEKTSIANTIRRIDYLVRGMLEDVINVKTQEDIDHIYQRDNDVNRLTYLIFRIINKAANQPVILNSLKLKIKNLFELKAIVFHLEQIGDFTKRLAKTFHISNFEKNEEKEAIEIIESFVKLYSETMESYYKSDKDKSYNIEINSRDRITRCKKILQKYPKFFTAEISYLLQNISRAIRDISRVNSQKLI